VTLTAVIIAKNEESNIKECIASIQFADEIIVVDDLSTDATPEIASTMGAKVFRRAMNGDYASQYNYALSQATKNWILIIDCDERVTPELRDEIIKAIEVDEQVGYEIANINFISGQELRYGDWNGKPQLRLFPRGTVYLEGLVHSKYIHNLPLRRLKHNCLHYPFPTWEKYFNKFNRYTELSAQDYLRRGKRACFIGDILIRPIFAFIKMYILKSGWRDGKIGFILALFHYFYTMTKYVKLYYMQQESEGPSEICNNGINRNAWRS
jgi:glycosyltransferase involved in cell wall biosynthesis